MPRIKGWKKVYEDSAKKKWVHRYENGDKIGVIVTSSKFRQWSDRDSDNLVEIIYYKWNRTYRYPLYQEKILKRKLFSNYRNAIRYAMSWMKKHPRG